MHYSLIVALSENGVMGKDGDLPWRLRSDLKLFRRLTMGKPLIMGRKTFETLPGALDGRDNIVVSRDSSFAADGAIVVSSLDAAYEAAEDCAAARGADEVMIIGGAQIYAASLEKATRIYLTRVHGDVEGDTYFPPMDWTEWRQVSSEKHEPQAGDDFGFTLSVYER